MTASKQSGLDRYRNEEKTQTIGIELSIGRLSIVLVQNVRGLVRSLYGHFGRDRCIKITRTGKFYARGGNYVTESFENWNTYRDRLGAHPDASDSDTQWSLLLKFHPVVVPLVFLHELKPWAHLPAELGRWATLRTGFLPALISPHYVAVYNK